VRIIFDGVLYSKFYGSKNSDNTTAVIELNK